jgi:hypothetical protein
MRKSLDAKRDSSVSFSTRGDKVFGGTVSGCVGQTARRMDKSFLI